MLEFINFLRLLATILITNSHFGNIWPVSAMASGGLLGNVIFLAVSGFLLFDIKGNFPKWFTKRFLRVYPVLLVFTLFTVLIGAYPLNGIEDAIKLFVYPTNYIFIVWLILCYVALYIVAYLDKKVKNFLEITMVAVFVTWLIVYAIFYDKSFYRVDNVSEPFILFLYFESMCLGAFFKKHRSFFGKFKISKIFITIACLLVYFASKIAVSRIEILLSVQILNQFVILVTLFYVFDLFMSLEEYLKKIPKKINNCVRFISNITLQIYIVQFVVIAYLDKLVFPLNLIAVTLAILAAASIVYFVELFARKGIKLLIARLKKGKANAEGTN